MEINKLRKNEVALTYSDDKTVLKMAGHIGYVRADFGSNGKQFFSTWWPFNDDLKSMYFKNDLQVVIDTLRSNGYFLSDRNWLREFCESGGASRYDSLDYYGVRVNTHDYSFLFRLFPYKGDYNFYCYCFKRDLLDCYLGITG